MINIQSPFRTAPDRCKDTALAVLFVSNGNSHTISTLSYMCTIYKHTLQNTETLVGQIKYKNWYSSECRVPRKLALV
jgi:hypothetical protein